MIGQLIATIALATLPLSKPLPGTYMVDLRRAPAKSQGVLHAIYGVPLRLMKDGSFFFVGVERGGFWREEGPKVILIFDGFFTMKSTVPDEILRKEYPTSPLDGIVLRKVGEELVLDKHEALRGPAIFRRQKPRPTNVLLKLNFTGDRYQSDLAFMELYDEMDVRWSDLLRMLKDPALPESTRRYAAATLKAGDNPNAADAILKTYQEPLQGKLSEKERARIRTALVRSFRLTKSPAILRKAFAILQDSNDSFTLSPLLAHAGIREAIPKLAAWAFNGSAYNRAAAIEALADLSAKDQLPEIASLTTNTDPRIQIAAAYFVLKVSENISQKAEAFKLATRMLHHDDWMIQADAVQALEKSGMKEAVAPLAATLLSNSLDVVRRNAALALGRMGFPSAVPALLEAKKRKAGPTQEGMIGETEVAKGVAEALWMFESRRR